MRFPRNARMTLLAVSLASVAGTTSCYGPLSEFVQPETPPAAVPEPEQVPYTSWLQVTRGQIGEDLQPTAIPGSGVLFSSNRHSRHFKLYLREENSERVRQITTGRGDDAFAALDPQGERIVFASNRSGSWQLYLLKDFDDDNPTLISEPGIDARCPDWSPSGNEIVYSRRSPVSNEWEIWVYNLERARSTRVTRGLFPSFSPDGTEIAFQRGRERAGNWSSIWTIRTDGTREFEIHSARDWGAANPCWSPDGGWIVFNSTSSRGDAIVAGDLYCIRRDGTQLQRLTFASGEEWSPHWSLDGQIYFSAKSQAEAVAIWCIEAPTTAARPKADLPHNLERTSAELGL